mgnify:CR=1 FL=1
MAQKKHPDVPICAPERNIPGPQTRKSSNQHNVLFGAQPKAYLSAHQKNIPARPAPSGRHRNAMKPVVFLLLASFQRTLQPSQNTQNAIKTMLFLPFDDFLIIALTSDAPKRQWNQCFPCFLMHFECRFSHHKMLKRQLS